MTRVGRVTTVIAAFLAAVTVLSVEASLGVAVYGIPVAISLLVAAAQGFAIPLAFVRPRIAMAVSVAGVLAFGILSVPTQFAPWPISASGTIGFALTVGVVGTFARWTVGAAGWSAALIALLVIATVRDHGGAADGTIVAVLIVFAAVSALSLGGGVLIRSWREGRRLLALEREVSAAEAARRELAEERTRIARELHDIVAHGMSAIQVQAASARFRMPELAPAAADEFDQLASTARSAMGEMRRLLSVLRDDDEAEQAPQPGLRELAQLLARPTHGGTLTVDDRLTGRALADPVVELTTYRVVQESLSNVARHAPGAAAFVALDHAADGAVIVEVRNSAPTEPPPTADPGGHGLRGMRERVELVGGVLEAGPAADGGFVVRARIPATWKD
ncbi:MAG: histidine kinase [Microbacterium sp.]